MPFLSAIGSLFGGGGSKQQQNLTDTEQQAAEYGLGQAKNLLPQGTGDLTTAQNFWQSILSGGRTLEMQALQPEVNTILSQYDTARKSAAEFSPRGSGRSTGITSSRFAEAGDISNLLAKARPQAAQQLTGVGQILSDIALGAMGGGTGASSVALNTLLSQEGMTNANAQAAGQSIGQLSMLMLLSGLQSGA